MRGHRATAGSVRSASRGTRRRNRRRPPQENTCDSYEIDAPVRPCARQAEEDQRRLIVEPDTSTLRAQRTIAPEHSSYMLHSETSMRGVGCRAEALRSVAAPHLPGGGQRPELHPGRRPARHQSADGLPARPPPGGGGGSPADPTRHPDGVAHRQRRGDGRLRPDDPGRQRRGGLLLHRLGHERPAALRCGRRTGAQRTADHPAGVPPALPAHQPRTHRHPERHAGSPTGGEPPRPDLRQPARRFRSRADWSGGIGWSGWRSTGSRSTRPSPYRSSPTTRRA